MIYVLLQRGLISPSLALKLSICISPPIMNSYPQLENSDIVDICSHHEFAMKYIIHIMHFCEVEFVH